MNKIICVACQWSIPTIACFGAEDNNQRKAMSHQSIDGKAQPLALFRVPGMKISKL
jgi:hypothetical protein